MSQNQNLNNDTIDLKELFFSLISQWKIIALCIILSLICALLFLRTTPEIYSVDALVQVEDAKGAASAALLGNLGDIPGISGQKSLSDAEKEVLNSRMVLGEVISNLSLDIYIKDNDTSFIHRLLSAQQSRLEYSDQGVYFNKQSKTLRIKKLIVPNYYLDKPLQLQFNKDNKFSISYKDNIIFNGILGKVNYLNDAKGQWNVEINSSQPFQQTFTIKKLALPTAVELIKKNYSIAEKGKMSGVIGLSYQGINPKHITTVLNSILIVYHVQNIERKTLESKQTLSFLDKQLPELRKQLEDSERKFNQFREQNNTVDVTQESELFLKQNIQLETMKTELEQKQAEMSAKYTNDHPLMREINAQLETVNKKIKELNSTLKRLPELQRQYLQLYRDVQVNTSLYTSLLNSYQQLRVAKAGEIGNVRVVDTAVEPTKPIKPRKLFVLALSIFIGGFIGVLIALIRIMLRSGIKDSSQIENEFDLPVYATVPRSPVQETRMSILKKKKSIPILAVKQSDDIAIESLRSIRTAIHFALANAKNNIITISGPAPEIGKSFISTNLATIFAQSGKRILLIDADLRRGYMHKYFNLDVKPGLADLISNQANVQQVIHQTSVENLDMITRGKSPASPSELLSTSYFGELLEQLRTQYDHIIIDTPPVLAVTDGIIISQYSGVNLVVARYAKTQMKELELTLNRFEQANVKVNGFILNDIQQTVGAGYGYSYAYAYTAHKDDKED